MFASPRSRLKIWSRETGSAVPSRISLLIHLADYGFAMFVRPHPLICDFIFEQDKESGI